MINANEDKPTYTEKQFKREGKECWYFGMFIGAAVVTGICGLAWPTHKNDEKYLNKYLALVCKTKGLELNKRNADKWCMDPKTKAIYEIEE